MKYKLINRATTEAHMCDKVTIGGLDYYVSDEDLVNCKCFDFNQNKIVDSIFYNKKESHVKKVIATNNPSIDIPKVVDEVTKEAERDWIHKEYGFEGGYNPKRCIDGAVQKPKFINGFVKGYNKSQETHPFSDDDMIAFGDWLLDIKSFDDFYVGVQTKELLQLWKSQQPKVLYYEAN